ncbi:hypothetical protein E4U40_007210 [Claviceps sp. LM458 group G5]|nr:hypothetical protein E4U40_007210 [Claviceps sp. LM458 group G5]
MFSVANHPGVKVDLDRWITQVRRVMAERDAYKEQVGHLTHIAQTTEDNLARFHGDHTRRLVECEGSSELGTTTDQKAQIAAKIMDLKDRKIRRLLRRLTDADNAKPATGHGVPKTRLRIAERVKVSSNPVRLARATVDTVTTTGSTTKRSTKMPDPPIFQDSEGSIDLEDRLTRITSTLQANAVVFRRLGDVRVSLDHNTADLSDPQTQIDLHVGMICQAEHTILLGDYGRSVELDTRYGFVYYLVESAVIVVLHDPECREWLADSSGWLSRGYSKPRPPSG